MEIIIILVLILLNGIFSMSEISLVSSRKFKLESAAKKGDARAQKALDLINNPTRFLSTVQIGITLIGILTGVYSGDKIGKYFEVVLVKVSVLQPYAHSISVVIVVVIITFFSILFGELLPKRIGLIHPEPIATVMAGPMHLLSVIAAPFIWLLTHTNDLFLKLLRIKNDNLDNKVSEEEIKAIIQESSEGGEVQAIEKSIVDRVFALGDRRVSELMTHRSDLVWFDINDDLDAVREKMNSEVHSMYPVSDGELDKLAGVVIVKEFFTRDISKQNFHLREYIKKPLVVHDNTPAYRVLEKFREDKFHYAIVVDEYGSIQGIMTMDDVLDALIGDVSDYDQDEYQITPRNEDSWFADAQYPYFEMCNYFGVSAMDDSGASPGEFNTIAGLILNSFGRVPAIGDKIKWASYEIEVIDMDGLRIDKVLISKLPAEA
ncbi:MAG: hemolysin family protein [Bacteroidota bacterium]